MAKVEKEPTYAELHKGKLRAYRIGRGRHVRMERTEAGDAVPVHYTDVFSGGENVILLTEHDARTKYHHMELSPADTKAVKVKEEGDDEDRIRIPADWQDMTPTRKLTLARKIGGKEVEKDDAERVITEYIAKGNDDGAGDSDSN